MIANHLGEVESERTSVSFMDFRPDNPFRPVDWRWERARQLGSGQSPRCRWDNKLTLDASRFLRDQEPAVGEFGGSGQVDGAREILGALQIRRGVPRRWWELEARILAGQSDEEIGSTLGVSGSIIEAYESLFFSVREKLYASDWVMCHVIGPKFYEGLSEQDIDIIWKLWAYRGGPLVLDGLIATHDAAHGENANRLDPNLARLCGMAIDATVLSASDDVGGALRLHRFLSQLDGLKARNGVAGVSRPLAFEHLEVWIDPVPALVGRAGGSPEDAGRVEIDGSEPDIASGPGHEVPIRRAG